jgi:hypothetical protein
MKAVLSIFAVSVLLVWTFHTGYRLGKDEVAAAGCLKAPPPCHIFAEEVRAACQDDSCSSTVACNSAGAIAYDQCITDRGTSP